MTADAFKQQFAEMCADYRRQLPEKFAELDRLWSASTPDNLIKLQRELHTLVGTAQTMGAPAVTEAARIAESFLEPYAARKVLPPPTEQAAFTRLLDILRQSAQP